MNPTLLYATDTSKSTKTTCNDVISACDKALADKQAQIDIRDQEMAQTNAMLNANAKEIDDLKRSNDAWYNSHTLWFFVGVAAAGGSVYLLKK